MSSTTDTATITTCANCSKAESDDTKLKRCTACKLVKYCCRDCQLAHRPKHKKACKKRAAELLDEELFKDHPESEECPICMLPLPIDKAHSAFQTCCGQRICVGCYHARKKEDIRSGKRWDDVATCVFCRAPCPTKDEEIFENTQKLAEKGNATAMNMIASLYEEGRESLRRDLNKAIEFYLKAAQLGHADAYNNLGHIYQNGIGVERDGKKARHYFELGAIRGSVVARHNLGLIDGIEKNYKRAYRHFVIGAKAGCNQSFAGVKAGLQGGFVTKDEYAEVLRAHQKQNDNRKTAMRDEAIVYMANPRLYWENP